MEQLVVINGSPKGKKSVSLKFVEYLQKKNPQTAFRYFNVAQDIRSYSRNLEVWTALKEALAQSQGVIWVFPVYIFHVPAALMRFLELVREKDFQGAFEGLYTTCISTSIHFYDNLTQDWMRAALEDLGMHYMPPFAAEQADFFKPESRRNLEWFFADFVGAIREQRPVVRRFAPLSVNRWTYTPAPSKEPVDLKGKHAVIVVDQDVPGTNLSAMVQRFALAFIGKVDIVELEKLTIRGGCLGCMKCAFDHDCTYADKDDIRQTYLTLLDPADIIIYAGALHQRYFSSLMKLFVERRFMRTHYPFMKGKQVALLVAGPLAQAQLLYDTFDADVQVCMGHFAGAVSDECMDSDKLDTAIDTMACQLARYAIAGYLPPDTFLGVAGRKLFRDEVWGRYRFLFQADHHYYRKTGFYDFPQKDWCTRWQNFILTLRLLNPKTRRQMRNTLSGFMVKPLMNELDKM